MHALHDTWVMAKRSLRHTIRSMDTIITVAATPIAMMLLFVYVFGGSFGSAFEAGTVKYIDFIVPGIVAMTVVSGIAYAALRLNIDLQKGIINRFKTMPVAPSSILGGHAVSSVLSNLFSVLLVILVAFIAGFRPHAGVEEWFLFGGLLTLFTLAITWMAIIFGMLAKTAEGAGSFSYLVLLLIFISSAFTPTEGMNPVVRVFAEHQPMTPIVETMRSLLTNGSAGDSMWLAIFWCTALLIFSYVFALKVYKKRTV
ncbi:MAG TPA: ABC transporter permease [Candidatus Saccharimonadales bacterium]|nr:ABC transporter permease [Candidatus Saccharimonadales bacterium]